MKIDDIVLGLKFKSDGVVYKITKLNLKYFYCEIEDDLICLEDTNGIVPLEKLKLTYKELIDYEKENPSLVNL
jgi:hypothetical protein